MKSTEENNLKELKKYNLKPTIYKKENFQSNINNLSKEKINENNIEQINFCKVKPILEQDEMLDNIILDIYQSKQLYKYSSISNVKNDKLSVARTYFKESKVKKINSSYKFHNKQKQDNYVFKARPMPEYPSLELKLSTTNLTIPNPPKLTSFRKLNEKK